MSDRLLTARDVADRLRVSVDQVRRWTAAGGLPASRLADGEAAYDPDLLDAWLYSQAPTYPPPAPPDPTVEELAAATLRDWLERAARLDRVVAWSHEREAHELLSLALRSDTRSRPGVAHLRVAMTRLLAFALETIERLEDGCAACGTRQTGWRREPGLAVCAKCEDRARVDLRSWRLELELHLEGQRKERLEQERDRLRREQRERDAERQALPTCVYLIGAGGRVKVGIAGDVGRRLRDLRTQAGEQLELVRSWRLERRDLARRVEAASHRELAEHRMLGEWFACEPDFAAAAVERAIAVEREAAA